MNPLAESRNPSDTLMWDIWTSMYHLPVVTAADELGIFNCLKNNEYDTSQLANELNLNVRSISVLVEFLIGFGFLTKKQNKINLTPTAKNYLISESPFYWGAVLESLRDRAEHKKIISAIKQGSNQLIFDNKSFTDMWQEGSITSAAANAFTKKMHATISAPAIEAIKSGAFERTKKLLDVGGGSGCFSIAFIQAYKDRKATVFELPAVCEVSQRYIEESNAAESVFLHPGNFFMQDNWPMNHDGILLSQILHDWPIDKCVVILKHAYHVLPVGGQIYIHEMLLDDNTKSPLATVCFDLLMFLNHQSQQFTKEMLSELLQSCGFSTPKTIQTFGYYSITTAIKN